MRNNILEINFLKSIIEECNQEILKLQQNLDSNSGSDTQDAIRLRYEIHKHYHRRQKAYENFQKHLKPKLVSK
jgi:hypothetical protein